MASMSAWLAFIGLMVVVQAAEDSGFEPEKAPYFSDRWRSIYSEEQLRNQATWRLAEKQPEDGTFEVRQYEPQWWLGSFTPCMDQTVASSAGYMDLYFYFNGFNYLRRKYPLTYPVLLHVDKRKPKPKPKPSLPTNSAAEPTAMPTASEKKSAPTPKGKTPGTAGKKSGTVGKKPKAAGKKPAAKRPAGKGKGGKGKGGKGKGRKGGIFGKGRKGKKGGRGKKRPGKNPRPPKICPTKYTSYYYLPIPLASDPAITENEKIISHKLPMETYYVWEYTGNHTSEYCNEQYLELTRSLIKNNIWVDAESWYCAKYEPGAEDSEMRYEVWMKERME